MENTERKAVKLEKNKVTNVMVIDDNTPKELYDVEIDADSNVAIGWKYSGGEFIEPKHTEPANTEE